LLLINSTAIRFTLEPLSPDVAATDLSQSITQNINSKSTLPK